MARLSMEATKMPVKASKPRRPSQPPSGPAIASSISRMVLWVPATSRAQAAMAYPPAVPNTIAPT